MEDDAETASDQNLGTVQIRRGIFQGDSLSPLLFIMIMAPLTMLLKDESKGYKLGNSGNVVNHLLFMDDLKLYARSQDEVDALLGFTARILGLSPCDIDTPYISFPLK